MGMVIPMVLMAVGTAVSVVGTIQQGKEAQRQANFQAEQAALQAQEDKYAATVAATNARNTESDAMASWQDTIKQRDRVMGQNRAAVAKSGLQFTGSVEYVSNDTALEFQNTANRTLNSGLNQAGNYRWQSSAQLRSASNMMATSRNFTLAGKAARKNSILTAVGQGLQGFGMAGAMGVHGGVFKPGP